MFLLSKFLVNYPFSNQWQKCHWVGVKYEKTLKLHHLTPNLKSMFCFSFDVCIENVFLLHTPVWGTNFYTFHRILVYSTMFCYMCNFQIIFRCPPVILSSPSWISDIERKRDGCPIKTNLEFLIKRAFKNTPFTLVIVLKLSKVNSVWCKFK